jgi:hypothetical protein
MRPSNLSSPFKGEVRRGMGKRRDRVDPIPTLILPLKGRNLVFGRELLSACEASSLRRKGL